MIKNISDNVDVCLTNSTSKIGRIVVDRVDSRDISGLGWSWKFALAKYRIGSAAEQPRAKGPHSDLTKGGGGTFRKISLLLSFLGFRCGGSARRGVANLGRHVHQSP